MHLSSGCLLPKPFLNASLSSTRHMLKQLVVKLQGLPLGPNVEDCLEVMRESAYQASLEERAKEENKPAW